jgi:hypothetical protein
MTRPRRGPAGCFSWFMIGIWTVVIVPFDAVVGWGLWHQARTYRFAETDGVVTSSGLTREGDSRWLAVRYEYEVGGRPYAGDRYAYNGVGTDDESCWPAVQKTLPAGKRVPVYYDPADPADAVLHRGPMGLHLFLVWFLTPFNAIGAFLWAGRFWPKKPAFDPDDRDRVGRTGAGWTARLPGTPRLATFAAVLLAVTFLGTFFIAFLIGFNPPVWVMAAAWFGAVALAAAAEFWLGGYPWLTVDEVARTLSWSAEGEVPFAAVAGVEVATQEKPGEDEPTITHHVEIRLADGPVRVATYDDRADADRLADWLRDRLG